MSKHINQTDVVNWTRWFGMDGGGCSFRRVEELDERLRLRP